ncbi:MAG: tetratricopeptide (TPR) repeat protein [Myxococcota bacterium]|jgi:tetratricopeptide (TPR) repeat protein
MFSLAQHRICADSEPPLDPLQGQFVTDKIDRFKALKTKFPDSEMPRWSLATAYEEAGSYAEAIIEFKELVALKPDYCIAFVHLGGCLIEEERHDEAIAALEEGIRLAVDQGHMAPKQEAEMLIEQAREELE